MARPALKHQPLWQLSVNVRTGTEEAVSRLLGALLDTVPTSYTGAGKRRTTVSAYLPAYPALKPAWRRSLLAALRALRTLGLDPAPRAVRLRRLRTSDWRESWKRHFPPVEVGNRLLIKPSWSRRPPRRGQTLVVLDPGLSFGTGQHPTTAYCLRELVRSRIRGQPQSLLDVGTGSGILAIAAARLGYAPVDAIDFDPDAVRIATHNARRNRAWALIRLRRGDIRRWQRSGRRRYDVICANLTADRLEQTAECLAGRLRPGGRLVLSGILTAEFERVRAACERVGLRLERGRTQAGWRSGTFSLRSLGCRPTTQLRET